MRYSALVAAAVLAFATPAFAQDRTIPAGALDAVQPPIDWQSNASAPARLYEGLSASARPATTDRARDLYQTR